MDLVTGVLLTLIGAVLGWAATQFLPDLWRRITHQSPITIYVETDPAIIWAGKPPRAGGRYLIPDTRDIGLPPSNDSRDWAEWLKPFGGILDGLFEAEVTLIANSDAAVVIDGVHVNVESRQPAPSWSRLICAIGGQSLARRLVIIQLEEFENPISSFRDFERGQYESLNLSLAKGDAEKLILVATAKTQDFSWTADLLAIVDGKRRRFRIDHEGKAFRTCGGGLLPTYSWYGTGAWDPPLPN